MPSHFARSRVSRFPSFVGLAPLVLLRREVAWKQRILWLVGGGVATLASPNEHLLAPVARDGLRLMTGIFWDLGQQGRPA